MTSSLSGITPGSWTYNTDDEFLTGEADSYDNNGNTTRSGANSYVFDSENHLKSMNGVVTMVYDGDGNRVAKTVNSVTTRYLVDDLNPTGEAQVVDELVGGVVTRQYTYGLERISENQFVNNAWTPGFYGYDGSGSVRQLTNYATGQITDTDDYDAFGNKVNSTGTTPNNYLYRGEQYDSDLGLYYLRARYYNPATGRFLNVDSLAGQGQRRYQYAAADPVNGMDPSGNADLVEYHPLCCAKAVPFPTFNFPPWCQAGPDISISSALPPCPVPPPPTCRPPKTLFAQSVDPGADYFSVKIDWLLSSKSCKGGVVVQHVVGDWPKADNNLAGHWNYWEAWQISKDNTQTAYHKRFGFDDRFGGFFGTKLHAEARFYEGTPLPNTFVAGSVKPAHDLPATLTDPHLSTANATPPVVRDFNR
jgi:RHS repeat-associated protein